MLTMNQLMKTIKFEWHGVELFEPDTSESSRCIAVTGYRVDGRAFHLMVSEYWEPLQFVLPPPVVDAGPWCRKIDTSRPSPEDIDDVPVAIRETVNYLVNPHSLVLLVTRPDAT